MGGGTKESMSKKMKKGQEKSGRHQGHESGEGREG